MQNDIRIQNALKRGFPLPDEATQAQLLHRCLEELNQDYGGIPLGDEQLDLLSAAGEGMLHLGDDSRRPSV